MNALSAEQQTLVGEFVATYDIAPDQISFDGTNLEPILDYEGLCAFREHVLDFASIDLRGVFFDQRNNEAFADCIVVTKRGSEIQVREYAQMNEPLIDGTPINSIDMARRVARSRALRSAIRCAGVSILKAHRIFITSREQFTSAPTDPRQLAYREIHALKTDLGMSQETYQAFIAEAHDGRTSCSDLDDIELQRLKITLRAMLRVKNAEFAAQPKAAA